MQKVLVIWLWWQWEKYVNYFIKNNYSTFWVCKTDLTKQKIEDKYNIEVVLDYKNLEFNLFFIIIICLPPEIQGKVSLDILQAWFKNKLIIEIPVTWNKLELEKLKQYKNAVFFLEEYYTLLSRFLRKIDLNKIKEININITINKDDYNNQKAREVTYIHINNNFLWINYDKNILKYNFSFHDNENIYYEIIFIYNWNVIKYKFDKEKYLLIWDKKYIDEYNFDFVLKNIIREESNFSNYYNI